MYRLHGRQSEYFRIFRSALYCSHRYYSAIAGASATAEQTDRWPEIRYERSSEVPDQSPGDPVFTQCTAASSAAAMALTTDDARP